MRKLSPYLISILAVVITCAAKIFINSFLPTGSPFLLFFTAITVSAWYGGPKQGFVALAVSVFFITTFFMGPSTTMAWSDPVTYARLALFMLDAMVVTLVCGELVKTRISAEGSLSHSRRSESKFRSIFDSNMIGLLFADIRTTKVFDANEYFLKLIGWSAEEVAAGKLFWKDITPPSSLGNSQKMIEVLKENGKVEPFQKEYMRKDGKIVSVLVGSARLDEDSVVTFVLDISERRNFERAMEELNSQLEERVSSRTAELSQSQKFLDSVVENIPNMIFVKEAKELRFVRFNRAGETLLGYSRDDLLGKNDYDFFPKEEADLFTAKDREVLEGKDIIDIPEETVSTKTGTRYLHTRKIPLIDESGTAKYLLGISEDITLRKEAELQLLNLMREQSARVEAERTAERFELLSKVTAALGQTMDVKVMLDSFARIVVPGVADGIRIEIALNPERKEIDHALVTHRDMEKETAWKGSRLQPYTPVQDFNYLNSPDGAIPKLISITTPEFMSTQIPAHVDVEAALAFARSMMIIPFVSYGKLIGFMKLIISDPNPRRFTDVDFELAKDLGRRLTISIENATLFEKAQDASRAKSAFLANMSHEIRTPLGAMLGFAELVGEAPNLTDEQKHATSTIIRNGQQLLRIVDEILDLSKVESERISIESIPVSVRKLLEDIESLMSLRAVEKNLTLKFIIDPSVPDQIISDPTRLRQVLINLIGNAIKFTHKGEVTVQLELLEPVINNSAKVRCRITDSGIGMSEVQRKGLFEPFTQADGSMTRRFGGTGLGLFLARNLARRLGGDVVLNKSGAGEGSEFVFTFTATLGSSKPVSASPIDHHQNVAELFKGARVLIVDDSADNRDLLGLFMAKGGFDFDTAENGQEGVDKALNEEFDVILMDIQMPGMDGIEAVKTLRKKNYHGPVIALTAHAMKGDRERFLAEGFDDYVCKPIQREALNECLQRHVQP
ncbi:MAG: PAS domain S-box protein [Bdellovibrionota bacterium]